MSRTVVYACMAGVIALGGCAALTKAEKTLPQIEADAAKACAELPVAESSGLIKGKAAKDAETFCAGVKFAQASSVTVSTPAGSASINAAGAPTR